MCIEKPCEFRETLTIKLKTILSQALKREGATTIPVTEVHSSEWKRKAPHVGDDIV